VFDRNEQAVARINVSFAGTAIDQLERLDRDKKNNRNPRFAMDMLLLQPRTA
jgi:hypothetical protein